MSVEAMMDALGPESRTEDRELLEEGYARAEALLHRLASPEGFWASSVDKANYRRVWGRDSQITSLAALMSGDPKLIETARQSLLTLARHQGPHGEIPSNVDPSSGRISYGGTAGRVDATLWFVIGAGEFCRRTGDDAFLAEILPAVERSWFLLGAWEFNNRGLIYVPETGDWADEYLQEGYVLYDQILYHQAGLSLLSMRSRHRSMRDHTLVDKLDRLRQLIEANYWFEDGEGLPAGVYHDILYRKSRQAAEYCRSRFWLPFFTPLGYGYRFDAFANVLVSLLGLSDEDRRSRVDAYIMDAVWERKPGLLPAFHPVIEPVDKDWEDLKMTFSYSFKNRPYEYHNGGLWPLLTGFYVADLAGRGRTTLATRLLLELHRANARAMEDDPWSFAEFHHGKTGEPGGEKFLGWNAAAAIIGHHALQGSAPFAVSSIHHGI